MSTEKQRRFIVVDATKPYHRLYIAECEKKYNATYMGYFSLKTKRGGWSDRPVEVFYQPEPDVASGHSHYFGLFTDDTGLYITNAISAFEEPMIGMVARSGEIVISRYAHDYRQVGDQFIDGGRDYTRLGGTPIPETVQITVKEDQFYADDEEITTIRVGRENE